MLPALIGTLLHGTPSYGQDDGLVLVVGRFDQITDSLSISYDPLQVFSSADSFSSRTYGHSGGLPEVLTTGFAGGGFDPVLTLYETGPGGPTFEGSNDDAFFFPNRDAWLTWPGVVPNAGSGALLFDPLPNEVHRLDLTATGASVGSGFYAWETSLPSGIITSITPSSGAVVNELWLVGKTADGQALVSLTGSALRVEQSLVLGIGLGYGQITLNDSASLINPGTTALANGSIFISGSNAGFDVGTLYINGSNAASVYQSGTDSSVISNAVSIGRNGSTGTLTMVGVGSKLWQNAGDILIGEDVSFSRGYLLIQDDARLINQGDILVEKGFNGDGQVLLSGNAVLENGGRMHFKPGSRFDLKGQAYAVTHDLTLEPGVELNFDGGRLIVDGGTFDPQEGAFSVGGPGSPMFAMTSGAVGDIHSTMDIGDRTSELSIGADGHGIVQIDGGAHLTVGQISHGFAFSSVLPAVLPSNTAVLNISGANTKVEVDGVLYESGGREVAVGDPTWIGTYSNGTSLVTVTDGAELSNIGKMFIGSPEVFNSTVHNNQGVAQVTVSGQDSIIRVKDSPRFDLGILLQIGAFTDGSDGIHFGTQGQLFVDDLGRVEVEGLIAVYRLGTVGLTGGTIVAESMYLVGGDLRGTGVIDLQNLGNLVNGPEPGFAENAGHLFPGNSAGTMSVVNGGYVQKPFGNLYIEIGGTTAGSEHDLLAIDGSASLGGTLHLSLINGFTPDYGDTFTILTAAEINGDFSAYSGDVFRLGNSNVALVPLLELDPSGSDTVTLITTAPGDLNLDGTVNIGDFLVFQNNFNDPGNWFDGDFNGDGLVNIGDFLLLQNNFNDVFFVPAGGAPGLGLGGAGDLALLAEFAAAHGAIQTPEPTAALLLMGLGVPTLARRRR